MSSALVSIIVVPGIVALFLCGLFTYLYSQSRESYFRAWQVGWILYLGHYLFIGLYYGKFTDAWQLNWAAQVFTAGTVLCILASTYMTERRASLGWMYGALALVAIGWSGWDAYSARGEGRAPVSSAVFVAVVLFWSAYRFWSSSATRQALGYRILSIAIAFWGVLQLSLQFHTLFEKYLGTVGHFLGPLPQMLLGIAMVMVLFEGERRNVQDNLLEFSRLDAVMEEPVEAEDAAPHLQKLLDRLIALLGLERGMICIRTELRDVFPTVERGVSRNVADVIERQSGADCFAEVAQAGGGIAVVRNLDQQLASLPDDRRAKALPIRAAFSSEGIEAFTVAALRTSDRNIGALIFPHSQHTALSTSRIKLLKALAAQIAMTLQHYLTVRESQRRSNEY